MIAQLRNDLCYNEVVNETQQSYHIKLKKIVEKMQIGLIKAYELHI